MLETPMLNSQSLTTVHELPVSHKVAPVQPLPPQRPQREAALVALETTGAVEVVLLETTELFDIDEDVGEVVELAFTLPDAAEEVEDEATLATLAPATAALPLVDEEDNLPTPALVLS